MKIASYNIWNSDTAMPLRAQQIYDEINFLDSDVICLQEVSTTIYNQFKEKTPNYPYTYFQEYEGESEGLAVLSKVPLESTVGLGCAIYVTFKLNNKLIKFINVHLPWASIIEKERLIVEILEKTNQVKSDYAVLAGDFNCSENSSVHQYITGQSSLLNSEAKPYWEDLAQVHAEVTATDTENTIDFHNNPRWKNKKVPYKSARFDRIYTCDTYPNEILKFINFELFGKEVNKQSGFCPSDHYGVMVELNFN